MQLSAYLAAKSLTLDAFGKRVAVSSVTVHRWARGKARPSWDNLAEIARATDGEVTVRDFMEPPPVAAAEPSAEAA